MYNQWNDPRLASPYGDNQHGWANAGYSYGHGNGFGFVDNDGRGQELAYQGLSPQQGKGGFSQGVVEQSDVQYQQQAFEQHQAYQQQQYQQQYQQQQQQEQAAHVHDPDKKVPQQWE
jgi:hypothetical protein